MPSFAQHDRRVLVQLKGLQSACGGMAAYAVLFAAEVSTAHGKKDVETMVIKSDQSLSASMGFDITETGVEMGYTYKLLFSRPWQRRKTCRGPHGPSWPVQLSFCLPFLRAHVSS